MATEIRMDAVYIPSPDVVAEEIEGELIIGALVAGSANMGDNLVILNDTGKAIWERLDGKLSLRAVTTALAGEYDSSVEEIEQSVIGFVGELLKRQMVVEVG